MVAAPRAGIDDLRKILSPAMRPSLAEQLPTIEFEVDARTNEIFSQTDGASNRLAHRVGRTNGRVRASGSRAVKTRAAEVNEKIFDPSGPIISKGPLDAGAGCPAGLVMRGGDPAEGCLHISKGAARSSIEQDAVRGKARASAQCRQPVVAGLACPGDVTDRLSSAGINAGIVPIALGAEHKGTRLEVGPERAADNAAVVVNSTGHRWENTSRWDGIFGASPPPAAIDAEIDTGPIIDRHDGRNVDGRRPRRRRRRQISGECRAAKSDKRAEKRE